MADFVAVLRKTIGSLGDNTPEMREKVFDKARTTIEAKLRAIEPPPPAAVIERQRNALEDAIATLRADYAEPPASVAGEGDDALESVLAALDQPIVAPPPVAASPAVPPPAATGAVATGAMPAPEVSRPKKQPSAESFPDIAAGERPVSSKPSAAARPRPAELTSRRRPSTGVVAALVAVLVIAGGGYFWWNGASDGPVAPTSVVGGETAAPEEAAATTAQPEATSPAEEAGASGPDAGAQAASQPEASASGADKFTQRLLPDGSEVDEGRAGGEPGIGEGSSVAASVQPPAAPEAASTPTSEATVEPPQAAAAVDQETGQTVDQTTEPAQPAEPAAVTVGQRAIFYEERTSTADGAAELGSIAWSLVEESPGGDLPPEPAIRAEATIPGKDVQLRMTIRRNGDQTLPASHIVEMIFLTPDGFGGGGVSSVSRIAFKDTEQAAGSPLVGIPAKIADGFFLIALSDAPAETQVNLNLLARQSWIDIPIVYQSGQRALLSLEKGIPGDRVFQEALRAWEEAGSG